MLSGSGFPLKMKPNKKLNHSLLTATIRVIDCSGHHDVMGWDVNNLLDRLTDLKPNADATQCYGTSVYTQVYTVNNQPECREVLDYCGNIRMK